MFYIHMCENMINKGVFEMFKSIQYVLKENFTNLYRIFCIAKYELLADMRDSKFGLFWNFASPAIQVVTYYLVFGIGITRGKQQGIEYMPWVVVGFAAWWFISPCITQGCSAIFAKRNVITKMKFPVSILPATVCAKEFFNHLCMLAISFIVLLLFGYKPNIYWLNLFYYMICAFAFVEALALITSVLTMVTRDVKKLVTSLMRMLLYLSPVLWNTTYKYEILNILTKMNPVYYIVTGYRDSVFFHKAFWQHPVLGLYFWVFVLIMFIIGCSLMYRFKRKFIDML